jgi:DNA-binding response OmpR family regulator
MELGSDHPTRLRVLVADDDAAVRELITTVLAEFDAEVEVAADGGEAWSLFEEWRPDLVLLDVDMPIVDGIEVCQRIRELDEDHEAFILFLADQDHADKLETLLDAGADEFIVKPLSAVDLRARLTMSRRRIAQYAAQRRAKVELVDARRLSAIGETTLSLQHEINNPLSALLGNAELLLMEMREKGEKNELLIVIHEQAMRIADVVRRLRRLKDPESVDYVGGTKIINFWKERAS